MSESSQTGAAMSDPYLEMRHLVKQYGALAATDDLSLSIDEHALHAIIGPNGAGKTTLLAQLAGQIAPTAGQILFRGQDITALNVVQRVRLGIARSFQITSLWQELSVLENVMLAVQAQRGHAFHFFRPALAVSSLCDAAQEYLAAVGLQARAASPAYALSHGEARQLELAVVLATRPRVLLLDEPLAGMGAEDSRRMLELLRSLKGRYTIVLVEHDMGAVFSLADRISVLVYGHAIVTDTPQAVSENEQVRAAYLGDEQPC